MPNKRTKNELLSEANKLIERTFDNNPTQRTVRGNRELKLSSTDPDVQSKEKLKKSF